MNINSKINKFKKQNKNPQKQGNKSAKQENNLEKQANNLNKQNKSEKQANNLNKQENKLKEQKNKLKEQKNKLKEKLDFIHIPEKLSPNSVQQMLREQQNTKKHKIHYFRYASIAAAIIMLLVVITIIPELLPFNNQPKEQLHEVESSPSQITMDREDSKENNPKENNSANKNANITQSAKNYIEIKNKIKSNVKNNKKLVKEDQAIFENSMAGGAENDLAVTDTNESGFSTTNTRHTAIEEGDVVKTDGNNLYFIDQNIVKIVEADGAKLTFLASIEPSTTEGTINEFYLKDKSLIILESIYDEEFATMTSIQTYDISSPQNPRLVSTQTQDGYYTSSRLYGNYLYTFSVYSANTEDMKEPRNYIPMVNNQIMKPDEIYLPKDSQSTSYIVMTSLDLCNPIKFKDQKSILSDVNLFYVSESSIYIAQVVNSKNSSTLPYTALIRFSYEDGNMENQAYGKIAGVCNDSFSLDEENGYLRVVTTIYSNNFRDNNNSNSEQSGNALYILNSDLKETGSIGNIAPGERVYSARFMGNIGYFVTFRQTDPLFSVDLSDPYNPQIIGALKIPGFSSYLHPYDEDHLVGIGMEDNHVKLSMFNMKDPSHVVETDKLILEGYHYSSALYNYKDVLFYKEGKDSNMLLGFSGNKSTDNGGVKQDYFMFTYDETQGFKKLLTANFPKGGKVEDDILYIRGTIIKNHLYVIGANKEIQIYKTLDYKKEKVISLSELQ